MLRVRRNAFGWSAGQVETRHCSHAAFGGACCWLRSRGSFRSQAPRSCIATPIRDLGFDPIDVGPLRMARHTEPLAVLVAQLAYAGFVMRVSSNGSLRCCCCVALNLKSEVKSSSSFSCSSSDFFNVLRIEVAE